MASIDNIAIIYIAPDTYRLLVSMVAIVFNTRWPVPNAYAEHRLIGFVPQRWGRTSAYGHDVGPDSTEEEAGYPGGHLGRI